MFNKMVVKRVVCLLVMLAAVIPALSAQRVWKSGDILPLQGVFPSVGDYMGSMDDKAFFQFVVVDVYGDNHFHIVCTRATAHSFDVLCITNDPFLMDFDDDLPRAPWRFSLWTDSKSVRIMDKLTGGYRPSSVIGDSGDVFSSGADEFSWGINYHGFSREELDAGAGFVMFGFSGSGDWDTERSPTLMNPDGKTVFYTPYKGQ